MEQLKLFTYKGKTHFGQKIKGRVIAEDLTHAKERLYQDGIQISALKPYLKIFSSKQTKKISRADIVYFCRQLSTLINAGININDALKIIQNGHEKLDFQNMVYSLRQTVSSGQPLHIALREFPKYFDDYICETVNTAEHTGNLAIMLDRLATSLEKTQATKRKVKKALAYPIVVLCLVIIITTLMMIFLVPKFAKTYESFGAKLPAATRALIDISYVFNHYWYIVLGIIVAVVLGVMHQYRSNKKFQYSFDRFLAKFPVLGQLIQKSVTLRVASALSTSIRGGVPAAESLYRIAPLAKNLYFSEYITKAADEVNSGQKIATALRMTTVFPGMLISMVTIGEESGNLAEMLEKTANYLEDEIEVVSTVIQTAIEPLIIIVIALLIAGIIIPLYLPIFNLGKIL